MTPETVALVVVVAIAVGLAAGMMIEQIIAKKRRDSWREKNKPGWGKRGDASAATGPWITSKRHPIDAADQLRTVMNANFTIQPLLNQPEARLFKELDRLVIDRNSEWQVMAQVSLGEVLRCKDAMAYSCINSKRVDLLLMDGDCKPRHAIEYQGSGHHQGTAAARDAVKKEALRRAGIGYHEVVGGHTTPAELKLLVAKLVNAPEAQPLTHTGTEKLIFNNAGRPWSAEDDSELLQRFHSGEDIPNLAIRFKRTHGAITARLERLETLMPAQT